MPEPTESIRILWVEDYLLMQRAIARTVGMAAKKRLERLEFATNFDEAVQELSRDDYDIVFSDLNLRGAQTGRDVLLAAERLRPKAKRYLVSGEPEAAAVAAAGLWGFVKKPFEPSEILKALGLEVAADGKGVGDGA